MPDCLFHSQLGAYHDGELDADSARRLSEHLPDCEVCRMELVELERMTCLFAVQTHAPMIPLELARLKQSLNEAVFNRPAESDFLRTAGMLSALAASILVISAVWLAEFPSRHTVTLSPGVAVVPASDFGGMPTALPDWERTALTLRVEPLPQSLNPGAGDGPQIYQTGLADSRSFSENSVDSQVTDWIVAGLSAGAGHANP